jgi:hypothetical protein
MVLSATLDSLLILCRRICGEPALGLEVENNTRVCGAGDDVAGWVVEEVEHGFGFGLGREVWVEILLR